LIVEGVGGEDGVGFASGDERGEVVVADGARSLFDGLARLENAVGDAGVVDMEGDVEAFAEIADEVEIGVGLFRRANAVVDVGGAEADAERVTLCRVGGVESKQKGH